VILPAVIAFLAQLWHGEYRAQVIGLAIGVLLGAVLVGR
jgi:tetrahydromethanopterin S-methyltransferase subunit F